MSGPDFSFESEAHTAGSYAVCGVDEVGRGPLAGPVIAAAVILPPGLVAGGYYAGLNDSKKLSAARREELTDRLQQTADVSIAAASVSEIDELNILQASLLAMRRAVAGLKTAADCALIDGNRAPGLSIPCRMIVKGDGRSLSIAAASVVAKVTRDRLMVQLHAQYPDYGWAQNMGYPTAAHREALIRHGITAHHRRSFAPVRAQL